MLATFFYVVPEGRPVLPPKVKSSGYSAPRPNQPVVFGSFFFAKTTTDFASSLEVRQAKKTAIFPVVFSFANEHPHVKTKMDLVGGRVPAIQPPFLGTTRQAWPSHFADTDTINVICDLSVRKIECGGGQPRQARGGPGRRQQGGHHEWSLSLDDGKLCGS